FGYVDFDGADFGAGSAEAGGVWKPGIAGDAVVLRRDDGSDGAGVGARVVMAANFAVDGAGVEAGSAPDAVQGFALFGIGEELGAAVVHEDYVKFFRAVGFPGAAGSGEEGCVDGEELSRAAAAQEFEEDREVLGTGDHFFDPGDG